MIEENKKYRKKPVVVEAEQFRKNTMSYPEDVYIGGSYCSTEEAGEWCRLHNLYHLYPVYKIMTLEGEHIVSDGDWIITGVKGEKYPCKPDIFQMTYEPVEALFKGDENGLLTPEEIETAEKEGAEEYKRLVANLEITYTRDGLVLWIQQAICKAQQLLTRQEIPEAVKAERIKIANWLTRKVYSDGLLLPHSIIDALKGVDK